MSTRLNKSGFARRPADPETWVRAAKEQPVGSTDGAANTARLTIDVTPAQRGRIKIAAFERAIEPQITAIYRRFGLNDRQIEILARATPKRDYYCQSRRGNRLFELGLSEVGLALCAASSKSDQTAIARIHLEHGSEAFLGAWLRHRGVDWAADLIPDLTNLGDRPEATEPARFDDPPAEETNP